MYHIIKLTQFDLCTFRFACFIDTHGTCKLNLKVTFFRNKKRKFNGDNLPFKKMFMFRDYIHAEF